jgi:hypothetical protein
MSLEVVHYLLPAALEGKLPPGKRSDGISNALTICALCRSCQFEEFVRGLPTPSDTWLPVTPDTFAINIQRGNFSAIPLKKGRIKN